MNSKKTNIVTNNNSATRHSWLHGGKNIVPYEPNTHRLATSLPNNYDIPNPLKPKNTVKNASYNHSYEDIHVKSNSGYEDLKLYSSNDYEYMQSQPKFNYNDKNNQIQSFPKNRNGSVESIYEDMRINVTCNNENAQDKTQSINSKTRPLSFNIGAKNKESTLYENRGINTSSGSSTSIYQYPRRMSESNAQYDYLPLVNKVAQNVSQQFIRNSCVQQNFNIVEGITQHPAADSGVNIIIRHSNGTQKKPRRPFSEYLPSFNIRGIKFNSKNPSTNQTIEMRRSLNNLDKNQQLPPLSNRQKLLAFIQRQKKDSSKNKTENRKSRFVSMSTFTNFKSHFTRK